MNERPNDGFLVTERIDDAHPRMVGYALLPGDLLVRDGTRWFKEAPGLAVGGFVLTPEQETALKPTGFYRRGLEYILAAPSPAALDRTGASE